MTRLRTFALCGVVAGVLAAVYVALLLAAARGWRDLETADYV